MSSWGQERLDQITIEAVTISQLLPLVKNFAGPNQITIVLVEADIVIKCNRSI